MGITLTGFIMTTFVILLIYILNKLIPYLWSLYKERRYLLKHFPAPDYHWFLGHLKGYPGVNEAGLRCHQMWTTKHPRYYLFFVGPIKSSVLLNHPETIKEITNTAEPKQLSGTEGGAYAFLLPWLGEGLLLSSGEKWFRNRKLLTACFHFDILKQYVDIYNDSVEKLMEKFERESYLLEKSIDVFPPIGLCTFEIILRCACSNNSDIQIKGENMNYVTMANSMSRQVMTRVLNPHLYSDFLYYLTKDGKKYRNNCLLSHKVAEGVIEQRKAELLESDLSDKAAARKRCTDFLDILLLAQDDEGNGLTNQEIRDEVETFMFAGHDTTKSALSWILYNFAKHPDFQARAREEVDSLLEGRENDRIQWKDLNAMVYLTRCIKESLRTHPPVPFIGRTLTKPKVIDGKTLPVGTKVDIMIWNLHHNPAVWENPYEYDPDRFLPNNLSKMDSHAFLPFSAGPRNCIGQNFAMNELRTAAARIIRRFELSLDDTKEVKVHPDTVLRPKNGIYIIFKLRQA